MIAVFTIPLFILIVIITWAHHHRFDVKKLPVDKWWHLRWGFVYAVPAAYLTWRYSSWMLGCALAVERFVFYDPALNIWRKNGFFHIVSPNSKPGMWDKIKLAMGKVYPYVWAASLLVFITIIILIIRADY